MDSKPLVDFVKPPSSQGTGAGAHAHGGHTHDHGGGVDHGHSHEAMENPGRYTERDEPVTIGRNFRERSFTIGVGGPVGSGKTKLVLELCKHLRSKYSLAVVTNDIFTKEDAEFLVRNQALPEDRILAVETGGCPHAAVREDISPNIVACESLSLAISPDLLFVESGGDNLAANFSRELADYIIYVIDVAGGDKVPRKGGPGVTQSDLLVINKIDLAEAVGADLSIMERDSKLMRDDGPFIMASLRNQVGVDMIAQHILEAWKASGASNA
mmetsp:Transcript_6133/g.25949  ORF Transcript_6133/g.25949 Transcript_6133/m.25949 type:complete len:270 (-) Transcript_6133:3154-3963(-)